MATFLYMRSANSWLSPSPFHFATLWKLLCPSDYSVHAFDEATRAWKTKVNSLTKEVRALQTLFSFFPQLLSLPFLIPFRFLTMTFTEWPANGRCIHFPSPHCCSFLQIIIWPSLLSGFLSQVQRRKATLIKLKRLDSRRLLQEYSINYTDMSMIWQKRLYRLRPNTQMSFHYNSTADIPQQLLLCK